MGMFIRIEVDQDAVRKTPGAAKKLVEVCPVNIFALGSEAGSVAVVEENADECTLCELCIQACPDAVQVIKAYDGDAPLRRSA
jgi:NAD-dependent dihydropyrimidine dehydrogenase PreA subunit